MKIKLNYELTKFFVVAYFSYLVVFYIKNKTKKFD